MEIKEIQDLIKLVSKSNVGEVHIEDKDFKLTIRNKESGDESAPLPVSLVSMPVQQVQQQPPANIVSVQAAAPAVVETPAAPEPANAEADSKETPAVSSNLIEFKSPMIGTFYRSPSPDKPPFVKVGDVVEVGDVVCIVEAMKLFNEIESEVGGKIVKILAENSNPVEYDTPLFLIEPV